MNLKDIRPLIRTKLEDGRLPSGNPSQVLGRPGDGTKCDACEEAVTTERLMMEIYFLFLTQDKGLLNFHGDCYALWEAERRTLKA